MVVVFHFTETKYTSIFHYYILLSQEAEAMLIFCSLSCRLTIVLMSVKVTTIKT